MKIYVKRNTLKYHNEAYSVEVLKRIENKCDCIEKIDYKIQNDEDQISSEFNEVQIRAFLVSKYMDSDLDYDYDDNPICTYYEDENLIPINYCPICGDKIKIIAEEVVDLTDEVLPILEELKELEGKRDSRKKRERTWELYDEIRKLMFL
jgi:hypothetical protein